MPPLRVTRMILTEKVDVQHQRRQFGRRDIARAASATLPGGVTVECRLVNVSEGGALVDFPGGLVPGRPFHLSIEGVPGKLACEPRHYRETALGVQFVRATDGVRLMALLFPEPRPVAVGSEVPRRVEAPMAPVPVRDLRQRVLATFAERPETPAENDEGDFRASAQ